MNSVAKAGATSLKRGTAGHKPRPTVRRKQKRTARSLPSGFDRLLARMHITPRHIRQGANAAVLLCAATIVILAGSWLGIPNKIHEAAAHQLARAGMTVRHIEINGLNHMDRDTVNMIALDQYDAPMLSTDLAGVRNKLMNFGWIADAQVSRRWPNTLIIAVQERVPTAVWQHDGALALIDGRGVVLQMVTAQTMPTDVPLVIGPNANFQTASLETLLGHVARLKPLIVGASWVGNRRWDLRFSTGEVLALPEGDAAAAQALAAFADQNARHPLLGQGYGHFDVRDGTRLIVQIKPAGDGKGGQAQSIKHGDNHA